MHESVTIEAARLPEDLKVVRELFAAYATELGIDLGFQEFDTELESLPGAYVPPTGRLLVARLEGAVVGVVALQDRGDGVCEMKRMVVLPRVRGSGLGRRLAEELLRVAREAGYDRMRLDTLTRLEPAVRLYTSMGFVEIPPYRPNPHGDVLYLELDLTAKRTENDPEKVTDADD